MNPHGLLMAYAEAQVKPVISDFDTFTIGSMGMSYGRMPADQVQLLHWALDHTEEVLKSPDQRGWMARWLEILKVEARKGFHPKLPEFGFGDPTSYGLISKVVGATKVCGAVRHGAECFNFYFPQELDEEFLVVWDGFTHHPPWLSFKEPELRQFLLQRAKDGYCFPINPVWPLRDPGWYEVLHALKANGAESANLAAWFEPRVMERIEAIHTAHPGGFLSKTGYDKMRREVSSIRNTMDLSGIEMADIMYEDVRLEARKRWRRARQALILKARLAAQRKAMGTSAPATETEQEAGSSNRCRTDPNAT